MLRGKLSHLCCSPCSELRCPNTHTAGCLPCSLYPCCTCLVRVSASRVLPTCLALLSTLGGRSATMATSFLVLPLPPCSRCHWAGVQPSYHTTIVARLAAMVFPRTSADLTAHADVGQSCKPKNVWPRFLRPLLWCTALQIQVALVYFGR